MSDCVVDWKELVCSTFLEEPEIELGVVPATEGGAVRDGETKTLLRIVSQMLSPRLLALKTWKSSISQTQNEVCDIHATSYYLDTLLRFPPHYSLWRSFEDSRFVLFIFGIAKLPRPGLELTTERNSQKFCRGTEVFEWPPQIVLAEPFGKTSIAKVAWFRRGEFKQPTQDQKNFPNPVLMKLIFDCQFDSGIWRTRRTPTTWGLTRPHSSWSSRITIGRPLPWTLNDCTSTRLSHGEEIKLLTRMLFTFS